MSLFLILCKRKKDRSMTTLKVLIWQAPLRERAKRERFEATTGSDKKKPIIDKDKYFFCKKSGHQKKDFSKYHT